MLSLIITQRMHKAAWDKIRGPTPLCLLIQLSYLPPPSPMYTPRKLQIKSRNIQELYPPAVGDENQDRKYFLDPEARISFRVPPI